MSYIARTINHFQAVRSWIEAQGGEATLDLKTFELEIRAHHRYFTLFPQFLARIDGLMCHVGALTPQAVGLIGWLPYRPLRLSLSTDKLAFKERLSAAGLRVPAQWSLDDKASRDFIVKPSQGSFGYGFKGPFHAGIAPAAAAPASGASGGTLYLEQFIQGQNLKVWFWGGKPFHAHLHDYPRLAGDGRQTVAALLGRRLERLGQSLEGYPEIGPVRDALAYQGASLDTVLGAGESVWLDFRYGRRFAPDDTSEEADNALPRLPAPVLAALDEVGQFLASDMRREVPVPVLCSLDAVLDGEGRPWWLEMNSNPIFPPTGYPHLLATLFGNVGTPRVDRPLSPAVALT